MTYRDREKWLLIRVIFCEPHTTSAPHPWDRECLTTRHVHTHNIIATNHSRAHQHCRVCTEDDRRKLSATPGWLDWRSRIRSIVHHHKDRPFIALTASHYALADLRYLLSWVNEAWQLPTPSLNSGHRSITGTEESSIARGMWSAWLPHALGAARNLRQWLHSASLAVLPVHHARSMSGEGFVSRTMRDPWVSVLQTHGLFTVQTAARPKINSYWREKEESEREFFSPYRNERLPTPLPIPEQHPTLSTPPHSPPHP